MSNRGNGTQGVKKKREGQTTEEFTRENCRGSEKSKRDKRQSEKKLLGGSLRAVRGTQWRGRYGADRGSRRAGRAE